MGALTIRGNTSNHWNSRLSVTVKVSYGLLKANTYILQPLLSCKIRFLCSEMMASLLSIKIRVHVMKFEAVG